MRATVSRDMYLDQINGGAGGKRKRSVRERLGGVQEQATSAVFRLSKRLRAASGTEKSRSGEAQQAATGASPPKAVSSANGNGNGSSSPIAGSSLLSFATGNPGASFSIIQGVLPKYFNSEWSFSQYRLPEETKSIVAYGPQKNTVIIVDSDFSFYKCAFDPVSGGEMEQHEYTTGMRLDDETAV